MRTSLNVLIDIVLFFGPQLLIIVLPFACCQSKKKFESDGKADLVPRQRPSSPTPPKDEPNSSIQAPPPTAQTPPAHTPVEPRSGEPEDTLANVKSLAPDSSEAPTSGKNKNKKKEKKN